MREILIDVDSVSIYDEERAFDAGLMFEHNAAKLKFKLSSDLINSSYKYYLEFATASGPARTDYLTPDSGGVVSYLLPAAITGQMSVLCYFNVIKTDPDTLDTTLVIKPAAVRLNFTSVESDSKELAESYDFSVNALLEAIKNGTFKGDKGDKGDKGLQGVKGDKGEPGKDAVIDNTLSQMSQNAVQNRLITNALNSKVDKVDGKELSENDFTDELKAKLESIEENADNTQVDGELSDLSENPVQNKVIYNKFDEVNTSITELQDSKANKTGTVLGLNASAKVAVSIAIGRDSSAANVSTALGFSAATQGQNSLALGDHAKAMQVGAIQLGGGLNETAYSFQVRSYLLLDRYGIIPNERLDIADKAEEGNATPISSDAVYKALEKVRALAEGLSTATTLEQVRSAAQSFLESE